MRSKGFRADFGPSVASVSSVVGFLRNQIGRLCFSITKVARRHGKYGPHGRACDMLKHNLRLYDVVLLTDHRGHGGRQRESDRRVLGQTSAPPWPRWPLW